MAEVRLEMIQKRVGKTEIIPAPGLTLTVQDGEFFTLVGPSGSGKSTVLHLIAGLDAPTGGRIFFDGQDVTQRAPRERDVALVFQNYALYPHMSVADNLAFPLRVAARRRGRDAVNIAAEVRRVAEMLGLEQLLERRPRELSGGQRQRVALGRALIRRPRVFLLDEPLSNLDAQLRAGMRTELRRLHDELNITMIYVTHDQTEAMTLADRVALLDRGRLQQVGAPEDLYDRPANVLVANFIGLPSMNILDARIEGGEAVAGPLRVPIPRNLAGHADIVRLGVRPEEVRVKPLEAWWEVASSGPNHTANGRIAVGTVRLVEPVGGQIWITVELGRERKVAPDQTAQHTIVGLAETGLKARPGERVALFLVAARPHFFDAKTGKRLLDSLP